MKLILLTSESESDNEVNLLKSALASGFSRIHVKRDAMSPDDMRSFLGAFTDEELKHFVIHSHYEVAEEYGIAGIHLPEWMRKGSLVDAETLKVPIISSSFHSVQEFESEVDAFEYAFIGPIYDSISKPGYWGIPALINISDEYKSKAVAIGGVTDKNIQELAEEKIEMVAVRGFIWESEDPMNSIRKITKKAGA